VDCLPVGDVPQPGSHDVIGDRAYAGAPEPVALLARAAMTGLMEGGVLPVVKHVPGHGRAHADSHLSLPVVDTPREALARSTSCPSPRSPTRPWR
jgi:beta-N-acetylhexosaminidase